jgi:hypothetical protein
VQNQLKKLLLSFTSRKFLVAVVTACLLFFDKKLGLGLDLEEKALAAGIGAFWIFAESAIDFKAVKGGLDPGAMVRGLEKMGVDPVEFGKKLLSRYLGMAGLGDLLPGAAPQNTGSSFAYTPGTLEKFAKAFPPAEPSIVQPSSASNIQAVFGDDLEKAPKQA